ncbi:MAG: carboxy-S-adenosyl-L-methionine synthase CmoA [Candidatus Azotimanducaceae bacterium WSBS_2022_MAG_OTU7]
MTNLKDEVYSSPMASIEAFRFDQSVADVFQDMIERSVPGYGLVLQLIGVLAEKYGEPGSRAYDLGCSLGASTLQLRRHLPNGCHLVGVDNAEAMVSRCKANLSSDHSAATYEILLEDLRETNIENASIVILNFTLQFIPDEQREKMLARIYAGLNKGGILLLAEKVKFENPSEQALMTTLHHDFKKQQGYSDLEISQKRAALENVLIPNTEAQHRQRMQEAGFSVVEQCVRCLNFATFLGIK